MEFFGYLVGFVVGVLLGMLGGGGSLLVPAMLYLLHLDTSSATAYTTLLVGVTSLFGLIPRIRSRQVDWSTVVALGIPISLGMVLVRGWLFDVVPDVVISSPIEITKRSFVLLILAGLLLFSFASMTGLIGKNLKPHTELKTRHPVAYYAVLTISGILIGIIPGFTGAGGGVLIVPLLVVFFGTPMKTVVGTSLAIITAKSFIGFSGDLFRTGTDMDWAFLGGFSLVMIAGVFLGTFIIKRIDDKKLKVVFAWFVLLLAVFILFKEFFF